MMSTKMQHIERHPMDKQGQFIILLSGLGGLVLAILTSRPRRVTDGVTAVFAGAFGSLIIAPAAAEAMTNFSQAFPTFSWLSAAPGTALFNFFIGLGGLLGGQMVFAFRAEFVAWVKKFARHRIRDGRASRSD